MKFEIFKAVLLGEGIYECEFYLRSSKKEGFLGCTFKNNSKNYSIVFDNMEQCFNDPLEILSTKIIEGKTLVEVWDDLEISYIDGFDDEEYTKYICTPNFYLIEYAATYKEISTVAVPSLINELKESEYNGNIILYAGTREFCDFLIDDTTYVYYLYDTFNNGIYLLKKEDNKVSFEYLSHWYERKKLKIPNLSFGRKYDRFSLKSGKDKSERYNLMMKFQKNIHQDFIGSIFGFLDVICFFLFLIGIGLKSILPMFVYYSLIAFVLSLFFTFFFSKRHNKEYKKLHDKLFPKKESKTKYTDMFLQIQKEAEENRFHDLHESLIQINKKIKMSGGSFEDSMIDLCFKTKEHEFFIAFYNKYVLINIDEESIDLNIKFKYVDFKDYSELESKIYSTIIDYL